MVQPIATASRLSCAWRIAGRPVHRAREDEILRLASGISTNCGTILPGVRKAGVHIQPRAGAAVFGQVKVGRVEPLGDVAALVDPQEEERHALRPFALQGGGAVAGLFEADAEAGGDMVEVVFRRPRLGQKGVVGHQDGGGEVVRQFHPQPRHARADRLMPDRSISPSSSARCSSRPAHVHQLEGAVGVVQRLGQQDLAPRLVILAQRAGQVLDPAPAAP